jgi:hypothetical protein
MNETTLDLKEVVAEQKKAAKKSKRVKKEEKREHIFTWRALLAVLVLALIGVAYGVEQYAHWRAEHQPRLFPWNMQWVGFWEEIERSVLSPTAHAESAKVLTDMEIIDQYKLAPVLHSIYMLESTEGKNDGCKEDGKVNGYGYRQNSSEHKCFDSFEKLTFYVNADFEKRLSENGNNLIEAVCYYNTGVPNQSTCGDYSENFMSVITNYF